MTMGVRMAPVVSSAWLPPWTDHELPVRVSKSCLSAAGGSGWRWSSWTHASSSLGALTAVLTMERPILVGGVV